ncbi:MAG: rplV [Chlamydiales bacterium]|jgi:large subunit ribosomal protein L22|nr:rplV [Chlamydiales bacterium]
METAKAITKYVRISYHKARLAADLIRGLNIRDAEAQLTYSQLKGGRLLKKTLMSAVANATNNYELSRDDLKVIEVRVDQGPPFKRSKPKSKGGRVPYVKRTSHFTVVVGC